MTAENSDTPVGEPATASIPRFSGPTESASASEVVQISVERPAEAVSVTEQSNNHPQKPDEAELEKKRRSRAAAVAAAAQAAPGQRERVMNEAIAAASASTAAPTAVPAEPQYVPCLYTLTTH